MCGIPKTSFVWIQNKSDRVRNNRPLKILVIISQTIRCSRGHVFIALLLLLLPSTDNDRQDALCYPHHISSCRVDIIVYLPLGLHALMLVGVVSTNICYSAVRMVFGDGTGNVFFFLFICLASMNKNKSIEGGGGREEDDELGR